MTRNHAPRPRLPRDMAPADPEAERVLIAALTIDPSALGQVAQVVRPAHFTRPGWRRVFEAMLALRARGAVVDYVTLADEVGDARVMTDLTGAIPDVPYATHAPHYAEIVRRKAVQRDLLGAAGDVARMAYSGEAEDPVAAARAIVDSLADDLAAAETGELSDALADLCNPRPGGWTTGIGVVDSWLGGVGLVPGRSLVISGKTGAGKTLLATSLELAALRAGACVVDFSLEMTRAQRVARIAGPLVGARAARLLRDPDSWTDADRQTFSDVVAALEALPGKLWIYQDVVTAEGIEHKTLRHGADVILVDWYQQIRFDRSPRETMDDVDKEISRRLAYLLPKRAGCCVIIVSQQNRQGGAKYGAWLEAFSHAHLTMANDEDAVTQVKVEPVKNRWGIDAAAGASAIFDTNKAAGTFRHLT